MMASGTDSVVSCSISLQHVIVLLGVISFHHVSCLNDTKTSECDTLLVTFGFILC